jgi:hypothetical protein
MTNNSLSQKDHAPTTLEARLTIPNLMSLAERRRSGIISALHLAAPTSAAT